MEHTSLNSRMVKIGINGLHVSILLLLAGAITWLGLNLGLSYEYSTIVASAYLILDLALSMRIKYMPSIVLTALIALPIAMIVWLFTRKSKKHPSAVEIKDKALEKSEILQLCASCGI